MAPLRITTSTGPDGTVVALAGDCDFAVREELTSALSQAASAGGVVVVDLADVTFFDSSAVHALVTGHHTAMRHGGRLHTVNAVGVVAQVLALTELDVLLRPPAAATEPSTGSSPIR